MVSHQKLWSIADETFDQRIYEAFKRIVSYRWADQNALHSKNGARCPRQKRLLCTSILMLMYLTFLRTVCQPVDKTDKYPAIFYGVESTGDEG